MEKLIRIGAFRYHNPEEVVRDGEEVEVLVERTGFHCETVDIPREEDIVRGESLNAFWTPEEAVAHYAAMDMQVPWQGSVPELTQAAAETAAEPEEIEVELKDLPQQELVDWLMSTGQFDGNPKPTVEEVVDASEGDAQLAEKLIAAEKTASGDAPRKGVVDGLQAIIDKANA